VRKVARRVGPGLDIHVIVDNCATHKHLQVRRWVKRHPRVQIHFVPISSSRFNLVEVFFSELTTRPAQEIRVLSELRVRGRIASFLTSRGDLLMSCPHCLSTSTSKRKHRTPFGYRTFFYPGCGRRFNQRTCSPSGDLQNPTDIVLLAVLWRLRYKLSFRDVAELLLQRGFEISHETIRTWEFRFTPMVSNRLCRKRRDAAGISWYLDETYIKVSGRWRYLCRVIDRDGNLLDSMPSEHRDRHAARRFLRRLFDGTGKRPFRVTIDKHPAYTRAIRWTVGRKVLHHHNRYLNNRIEQNHRPIKQRYYPMLGVARFESASRFCTAFDELRNYMGVQSARGEHVPEEVRRKLFKDGLSNQCIDN